MSMPFGHLEGVVTKICGHQGDNEIEVRSAQGITCHVCDLYDKLGALEVGMKLALEEANVQFDNGRILYIVDENLRGVAINDVCLEDFFVR